MNEAASEQSQTTAAATSSGVPNRPNGFSAIIATPRSCAASPMRSSIGVLIAPADRVDADTMLRVVARGHCCQPDDPELAGDIGGQQGGNPFSPETEAVLTTAPPPDINIAGISCFSTTRCL